MKLLRAVFVYSLALAIALPTIAPPPAQAQFGFLQSIFGGQRRSLGSTSNRRRGGAGRRQPDLCPVKNGLLTALLPEQKVTATNAERPTFWVYIPYALTQKPEEYLLKFSLQDEVTQKEVYQATFPSPEPTKPGIVGLRLPPNSSALQANRTYRWYFLIYCNDPNQDYEPAYIEGAIQRIGTPITETNLEKRTLHYVQNQMWFDVLTQLVDIRSANPNELAPKEAWTAVIQSFELNPEIADKKIVGRYVLPAER